MIRTSLLRALMASAVFAGALALAGCDTDGVYQLPSKAMKALSPEMVALLEQKNMPKESPILVRIFKEESELEVWKQDSTGLFQLLRVYPICRWSGDLGPKVHEGDRQAPEGFYAITPELMNPNSNYYLAINTGFPNAYDKANGHTGAFLMIHGDCSSRGCYAMTDEQIGEIYSLAREAFLGGQRSFQIQAYPFRMTAMNLARHRTNPNLPFWKMLKEGNDHFEVTHVEPRVDVCDRRYVFDAAPPENSTKPLVFSPTGRCPAFVVAAGIAGPSEAKAQEDEIRYAQLSKFTPTAPIRTGLDGGMNRVFLAQTGGIPPARTPAPLPPQPPPVVADNSTAPTLASRLFGSLFGSKPAAEPTKVASADSAAPQRHTASRGTEPAATGTATQRTAGVATSAAVSELRKGDDTGAAKPKPAPQQEANAAAPLAKTGALINGAQPVVPAGSFDSRWSGLQ